jgi:hypothetical protein
MAPKLFIVRSITYRSGLAVAILLLITLPFCPWMWKSVPDAYFPYSGTVVDKGMEFHLFFDGDNHFTNYIVVEDLQGVRKKKYVGDSVFAIVQLGSFVVKKKGLGELPLRAGQLDPREALRKVRKEGGGQTDASH